MTDWEAQYLAGDTPWDKGAPAPPLLEWLAARAQPPGGAILVPGCGMGHDVRALASVSPEAEVIGLDLSVSAVAAASALPAPARVRFEAGDLFALPDALRARFDWVFEHTCFCAIDPARRVDYARSVATALKPGGQLLAIFYLDPYDPGEDATGPPHGVTVAELERLFSPAFEQLEDTAPTRAYPGREGRERLRLYRKRADFRS